ncbi:oligosaccharide flippase family protein [Rhodobacteraceae bacterium R_SAG2]|nr:oligosaccharide flippase family protein [Rhodobacteraceae bacterium R_SAG2]
MWLVTCRYRGFPVYRLPARFFLVFAMQAPLLFTARLFDAETTGQLGLAMMATTLPFLIVGQAMSRAYYGEMARIGAGKADEILHETRKVILFMCLLGLPVACILFMFAEPLAVVILGEAWAQAGNFMALLSIMLVPQFISATVIRSLDVLEAHRLLIMLHFMRLLLISGTFLIAGWHGASSETTILAYACALAAHYVLQVFIIYLALQRKH